MAHFSREIYENMPIYAQMADHEGVLKHICDAIQIVPDEIFRLLADLDIFFDPELVPDEWCSFIGQIAKLGTRNGRYLGIGINPYWPVDRKRKLIQQAEQYWGRKGTETGIRQAIDLWLDWAEAYNSKKLRISLPFGKKPSKSPHAWWAWNTRYDDHLMLSHQERKFFGGERLIAYRPKYISLKSGSANNWQYKKFWHNRFLSAQKPDEVFLERSRLGPNHVWLNLHLKEWEWRLVFPDFHELAWEIMPGNCEWSAFAWLSLSGDTPMVKIDKIKQNQELQIIKNFKINGLQYGTRSTSLYKQGGTLFPLSKERTITIKNNLVKKQWGVWRPRQWFVTQWPTVFNAPNNTSGMDVPTWEEDQSLNDIDIGELNIEIDLYIDLELFNNQFLIGGELFYAAWRVYEYTKTSTFLNDVCIPGLEIDINDDSTSDVSTISYGDLDKPSLGLLEKSEVVRSQSTMIEPRDEWFTIESLDSIEHDNLYFFDELIETENETLEDSNIDNFPKVWLVPVPTNKQTWKLIKPVKIANYYQRYNRQYPYKMPVEYPSIKQWHPINSAIETLTIDLDDFYLNEFIEPIKYSKNIKLCNVFGNWTTKRIINFREYTINTFDIEKILYDIYPILKTANIPKNWKLVLETTRGLVIINPLTLFWYKNKGLEKERSRKFSLEQKFKNLYLEFIFNPAINDELLSCTLLLEQEIVHHETFYYKLSISPETRVGLQFMIPFGLSSGADTIADELAILDLTPKLKQSVNALEAVISKKSSEDMSRLQEIPLPPIASESSVDDLRGTLRRIEQKLTETIELVKNAGDAYYDHFILEPTMSVVVTHPLKKDPSITFIDNSGGRANQDAIASVIRLDRNTILVNFCQPVTGKLIFN